MEQSAEQPSQQRRGNPAWVKGVSQNPAGRMSRAAWLAIITAKAQALARDLGLTWKQCGALDRTYLMRAAELLERRPRNGDDAVRLANTAQRLIASVERRAGRGGAHGADFSKLLGGEE